jgi:8-oxo-dGTP pyrophosphatase MutT (NUDIX family)
MDPFENPWKTLNSEIKYKNDWVQVREDQVIRPDGAEGIYGVVETRIATGVVAFTPDYDVYLVGQYRYPTEIYSWETIQGGADLGEDPLETAKRELQEEAGLIAHSWEPLGHEIHLSNCISSEIGFNYIAQDLEETVATPEGTEVLQIKKVTMGEAMHMVHKGEIQDGMTIMGLFHADHWLKSQR